MKESFVWSFWGKGKICACVALPTLQRQGPGRAASNAVITDLPCGFGVRQQAPLQSFEAIVDPMSEQKKV